MKILITGSSSGIGFDTGLKLLDLGNFVYFTVHRKSQVTKVEGKLKDLGMYDNFSVFKLDITIESDRKKLYDLDIDCLINNAAIGIGGSILDLDTNIIKRNFEVNIFSTVEMIQTYAASLLLKNKGGKIIVVSSLAGLIPIPFMGSYCATKAALITLITTLRQELKLIDLNVDICLIEPGIYITGFNEVMIDNKPDKSFFSGIYSKVSCYQKIVFKFFGRKNLNTITKQIVKATISTKPSFLYRAPFFQVLSTKFYMFLFK